jgi:Concanavalin A-like lectin/glucanases superfamily
MLSGLDTYTSGDCAPGCDGADVAVSPPGDTGIPAADATAMSTDAAYLRVDAEPDHDAVAEDGHASEALDGRASDGASDALADVTDAGIAIDANDGGDLESGLVAFYRFDETSGTTAADSSGNNRTATLVGGASFSSGLQNNAVTLNGGNEYVSLPNGIVSGLTSFSICAWVNLSSAPMWSRIFDFGTGTTTYMFLTPNSGAGTRFSITTGGNGQEQQLNATALATGSWQHVAVTLAANTGTLYVNGAEVAQNTSMTLNPASLGTTTQNWLGRSEFASDPYLNGQLDNFRIYDRALSAADVHTLYADHL